MSAPASLSASEAGQPESRCVGDVVSIDSCDVGEHGTKRLRHERSNSAGRNQIFKPRRAQLAAGFLRSGFAPVILIDTFSGDKIDGILDAFRAEHPQRRVCVSVLHASADVLRDRVLNREAGGFRDLAVSIRINGEVVRDARPFEKVIDTSDLSPTEVASAILGCHVAEA